MSERFVRTKQVFFAVVIVLAMVAMSTPRSAMGGDVGPVVDLVLLPSSQTVDVDGIFDISIQAQCNGQDISTVAAFIDFDPNYLEVQSVTPGPALSTVIQNAYNNTAGTIDYGAGKLGEPFPSGTFTVATVSFKALNPTTNTSISFSTVFPRETDADFGGTSKLDELFGATVTIVGVNTPPVLSNGQVNPDTGYVTTSFTYSVTYTDADNDPPASPTVSIDGGGPINMTEVNAGDTNYTDGKDYEYTTSGLTKGIAHTYRFAASDGVDDATGDIGSHDGPTVQNSLPTAPVVDVTPDSPVTTDNLVCNVTTPSIDPDAGDTVIYTYEWYKDSVLQPGLTTDAVAASNTAKGQVWRCVVTPNDGTANGPSNEDDVTILNSLPVANAGADQIALIGTNVTLDGSGSSDADDDPLDYSWTQTGGAAVILSDPTAVNATFTPAVADTYTFSLVVYDGIDHSLADTTVCTIKASNVAPVLSDGAVSPSSGRTSVTFTYSVVYTDDDNDVPVYVTITVDGEVPQEMSVRSGEDGNYTNGEIYEYAVTGAALGLGGHTFQFAASDGIADATGDIGIHDGPTVSSGGGGGGGGGGGDTRAPAIFDIEYSDLTKTSVTIKWRTDEGSTSQVEYWASEHIFSPRDETLVRFHEVELVNLKPCCDYHFRVMSKDSAGNVAISEEKDFTTLGTPAAFTISALSISPTEVQVGESITISALVTNSGDATGTYEAVLKIDNAVVATQSVTLAGGASEEVAFTTSRDVAGTYIVSVDDQSATLVVRAPTAFTISALNISPARVAAGEDINISALITNTGNVTGTYEAILEIDNAVIATQNVTLAGGASEEITFTTSKDVVGTYAVDLNGLLGTFVVKAGPNWWLIGGIVAGVVAVLLVLYFYVWRKRGAQKARGI